MIYGHRYRCWKPEGHGRVNLYEAIRGSCNTYFHHLGQQLGIDAIAHYAQMLGLGEVTRLDIGGEKKGLVPGSRWSLEVRGSPWFPGETISVAIGQGPILVTPLQMAELFATVANGGRHVRPRVALSTPV
ncbi:MAG: penicillin-binding protein 2, partial [Thermoanaerobaculia bacterium]|nr:penicillin-binding protein 2 [Thermoanaerobaculia bacterium]